MDIELRLLEMYRDPTLDEKPALLADRGGAFYSEAAAAADRVAARRRRRRPGRQHPQRRRAARAARTTRSSRSGADRSRRRPSRSPLAPLGARACAASSRQAKAYEELAVAAARSGDRDIALRALLANPLVAELGDRATAARRAARGERGTSAAVRGGLTARGCRRHRSSGPATHTQLSRRRSSLASPTAHPISRGWHPSPDAPSAGVPRVRSPARRQAARPPRTNAPHRRRAGSPSSSGPSSPASPSSAPSRTVAAFSRTDERPAAGPATSTRSRFPQESVILRPDRQGRARPVRRREARGRRVRRHPADRHRRPDRGRGQDVLGERRLRPARDHLGRPRQPPRQQPRRLDDHPAARPPAPARPRPRRRTRTATVERKLKEIIQSIRLTEAYPGDRRQAADHRRLPQPELLRQPELRGEGGGQGRTSASTTSTS